MNTNIAAISFCCLLAASVLAHQAMAATYDATNFNAAARKLQPVPTGHTPGKDNGPGAGTHNPGEDCGICHKPNGKAANYLFSMAGTLYEDRTARRTVQGGEVIMADVNGQVISMTSNAAGNFWTYTPIGSNPLTVASHSGITHKLYNDTDPNNIIPADPEDSRTWLYKAWVKNGEGVIRMVTIAPVGGSTDPASRMSCNMHHAGLGSRGGLWGSRKSSLPSYPSSALSFKRHIFPIFKSKCAPCHIPGNSTATMTRLVTASDMATPSTSIDYSKALDLTTYTGSTISGNVKRGARDLATPYQANPDSSPLLAVPSDDTIHPGGQFWTATDLDYKAVRQWISEGAANN